MDKTHNIRVLAAVIERQGRFLLCRRPPHKRHGDLWEFPGGKIETDETIPQAAARELKEELCLTVRRVGDVLLKVPDPASGYLICFTAVEAEGEPVLIEHSELAWVERGSLLALDLAPSDLAFCRHLMEL
ncbi:MAG: (deoxy)nucleoside triphosphate pyrophosphohydrolase [Candidatus Melainabacteria bacterium]|nr:(deoxy)nucleoside triphosphate pyrophosphohydrolase [Candidatus Melainabacteria bacterium]